MFNVAARAATPDSTLIFFMTLALAIYVRTSFRDEQGAASVFRWSTMSAVDSRHQAYYPRRLFAIPLYAAMGMAVLAKGPIGIVLPTAIIGLFLSIIRLSDEYAEIRSASNPIRRFLKSIVRPFSPLHLLRTAWSMRPITALTSAMAIALPWYLLVGIETDGKWVQSFFLEHNIGRASTAMEGHAGSTLFYYPLAILVGFFPWSILAVPVCLDVWHVIRTGKTWSTSYTFLLCWIGVFVGVFSLAQTKLPSYVTPAYPALALLAGACIERLLSGESAVKTYWLKAAAISLAAVGAVGIVAVTYAARIYLPGEEWLALIGVSPLLIGLIALSFAGRQMLRAFASSIAIAACAITLSVFGFATPRISARQHITDLLGTAQTTERPAHLASFAVHEPSWVFYANREVPFLTTDRESEAINFLRYADTALITTRSEYNRIRERLPMGATTIAESEYFLKPNNLVLISRLVPSAKSSESRQDFR
jgi:4-amino-4-deoxy-L-arabinose transferase-like glycosyltransferase